MNFKSFNELLKIEWKFLSTVHFLLSICHDVAEPHQYDVSTIFFSLQFNFSYGFFLIDDFDYLAL